MMIEQPLAWDDLLRHAELQKRLKTPICLDESITSVDRAEDMIALGRGRIINIKPGRVGGFLQSIAIHDLCAAHGIPVWCGGMLESGVGRAHNVALASLPNFTLPGDVSPSERYWERGHRDPRVDDGPRRGGSRSRSTSPAWASRSTGPGGGADGAPRDRSRCSDRRKPDGLPLLADGVVVFHLGFVLFACWAGC